jgi:hypothetical protein
VTSPLDPTGVTIAANATALPYVTEVGDAFRLMAPVELPDVTVTDNVLDVLPA